MNHPEVVLLIRFKSALPPEEITKLMNERAPSFRALEGLQQKYYLHDGSTGEIAGLYLWRSPQDLDAYRKSELRATIAKAYQAMGEARVEVYRVLMPLREELL